MSGNPDQRPLSPYMLGPYYRFQITSLLSITTRLTGIFLTVVTAPLAIVWLLTLITGEGTFSSMQGFLASWLGKLIAFGSVFSMAYHLTSGIRHLLWDTGRFFELHEIRWTGYAMLAVTLLLVVATYAMALGGGS